MRRFIQVLTLLVMILAGSWPAVYLGGAGRPESCCAGMTAGQPCPCRMPSRSSGPTAPCGLGPGAPLVLLAAPRSGSPVLARAAHPEPRPAPPALGTGPRVERTAAGPCRAARPGPWRPGGSPGSRQAQLSVFRI